METVTITVKKVTEDSVAKACADLTQEGLKPTVNAVRARLGGASPNDVAPLIKVWKAKQPVIAREEITPDPSIARLIAQQMASLAANAAQAAEARAAEAEENVQTLTENGQLLELRITQLQAQLQACQAQVQQQAGQLAERAQEIETIRNDCRAAMQASETKAANERLIAEGLRQELVRAQIRVDSIGSLEKALAAAQDQWKEAREALAAAQQAAAVSEARTVAATERAQHAEAREGALQRETAQLRAEVVKGHSSAQQLAATLATMSATLAASTSAEHHRQIKKGASDIATGGMQSRSQNTSEPRTS